MNRLPPEIFNEIFSYLPVEPWKLAKYATICKATWAVVSSNLYRSVRLRETGQTPAQEKDSRDKWNVNGRQQLLFGNLASNSTLAALVQEFRNDKMDDYTLMPQADPKEMILVANNLKRLNIAYVNYNPLASQLVTSPNWTACLSTLEVNFFSIEDFIWPPETRTNLQTISWTIPLLRENEYNKTRQRVRPDLLPDTMKIFALTCPRLESLDLMTNPTANRDRYWYAEWDFESLGVDTSNFTKYDFMEPMREMKSLRHFGLERWLYMEDEKGLDFYRDEIDSPAVPTSEAFVRTFIEEYKAQLTSLAWDVSNYPRTGEFLESELLPKLQFLTKFCVGGFNERNERNIPKILKSLSKSCSTALRELDIKGANGHDILPDGGMPLSRKDVSLFREPWFSNIQRLSISTRPHEEYVEGGFIDLDGYAGAMVKWARKLPNTLNALNVIVCARDIGIDVIEDEFPVFYARVADIFALKNLCRLRKCDFSWQYEGREGAEEIERLIFRRTKAYKSQNSSPDELHDDVKDLWVWWVGSWYQHNGHLTVKGNTRYRFNVKNHAIQGGDDHLWTMPLDELQLLHHACEDECEKEVTKALDFDSWDTGELVDESEDEDGEDEDSDGE